MRILDVSSISDVSEMPVKSGTLQFIQDSYKEIGAAIMQALLSPSYNPGTIYVLYGVRNTGTGSFYNISAGAIFLAGEVFLVPATSFTATGSNVGVFNVFITQFTVNADPVTFSDMTVRNVHNIRQIQVIQGDPTAFVPYSAASFVNFAIPPQLNLEADPAAGNQLSVGGSYPNLTLLVPGTGNLNPVKGAGSIHVGDVPTGGITIPIIFGTAGQAPVQTAPYYVMFSLISQGGIPQDDTTVTVSVIDSSRLNTGFSFRCQEWTAETQSIEIEYLLFAK
jgi:hypothetical protein